MGQCVILQHVRHDVSTFNAGWDEQHIVGGVMVLLARREDFVIMYDAVAPAASAGAPLAAVRGHGVGAQL